MPEIDIRHFAADAAEELISSYTVGIVADVVSGPTIGTGVAIEWGGRLIFLTAAHVVKDAAPKHISFFFKPAGNLQRQDVREKEPGTRFITRQRVELLEIHNFESNDLAALVLSRDIRTEHNVEFFRLNPGGAFPTTGTTVMLLGFPGAIAEEVAPGRFAVNRAIAYDRLVDTDVNGFDPNTQFSISYTYGDDINLPEGIRPHGFSGAGAWYESHEERSVWYPQPKLAGIIIEYYRRRKILAGVRIETVTNLLEEYFSTAP